MSQQLTPDQVKQLTVILGLMSQGRQGREYLSALQPVFAAMEENKRKKDLADQRRDARNDAIAGQVGGVAGQLGGLYLASKMLAPAAGAGAGAGAGGAGALAGATQMPAMLGGADALTGTSLAGTQGTGMLSGLAGYGLPIAAGAALLSNAWEGGLKDIVRGRGNRSDYTNLVFDTSLPGVNMGLRLLGKRSVGSMMSSGKSDDQQIRDDFRGDLKTSGVADKDYNVGLADGSKFNIGLDGKTKYTNSDGKSTRNAWDIDSSNPLQQFAVSQIDPLVRAKYKDAANPEQYTGMLVNAVTSNAKTKEDVLANMKAVLGEKLDRLGSTAAGGTNSVKIPIATRPPVPIQPGQTMGAEPTQKQLDPTSSRGLLALSQRQGSYMGNPALQDLVARDVDPTALNPEEARRRAIQQAVQSLGI